MKLWLLCSVLIVCFTSTKGVADETSVQLTKRLDVYYPKPEREHKVDSWYPLVLLKFALEHSEFEHTLQESVNMVQSRSLKELVEGQLVNVVWSMTSIEREQDLLPIRIPIYKGLYGLRLLFTTQDKLEKFANINDVTALSKIDFIQGHDWPDTAILVDNGFEVSTSTSYDALFSMLNKGRGDAFPRSILETEWELKQLGSKTNISVVPNIAIKYPAAIYYFVNPKRPDIHKAISLGLQRMHENGKFDELFNRYFTEAIQKAKLEQKTIIPITNKHMSELTPLNSRALWFEPDSITNSKE
ncbi:transporter substrate-binding domain-containing protein [Pseudoalteromonas sp. H105]|uniref:transporter substrate-binding domain-containing protein n=1 Tax=Pseudoalteromonas sp. H105 TaxID=1348393 RepID=UPI000731FA6E|nr:transporter substrate-binding domain-containing protein [Pseudoalteromonas sp. H105]KTF18246.1 hypothetical protein ATS75_02200 [Pseudoalteromonas sp. H105]